MQRHRASVFSLIRRTDSVGRLLRKARDTGPNLRRSPTGALFGIPIEYLRLLNLQDIIDLQHSQTDELKAEEFAATNGHTQFSVYCIGTRQQTVGMHKTMVMEVTLKSSVPQGQHPRSCSIAQFN